MGRYLWYRRERIFEDDPRYQAAKRIQGQWGEAGGSLGEHLPPLDAADSPPGRTREQIEQEVRDLQAQLLGGEEARHERPIEARVQALQQEALTTPRAVPVHVSDLASPPGGDPAVPVGVVMQRNDRGQWAYNPRTGEVWRVGREGGLRHPATGGRATPGTLADLDPETRDLLLQFTPGSAESQARRGRFAAGAAPIPLDKPEGLRPGARQRNDPEAIPEQHRIPLFWFGPEHFVDAATGITYRVGHKGGLRVTGHLGDWAPTDQRAVEFLNRAGVRGGELTAGLGVNVKGGGLPSAIVGPDVTDEGRILQAALQQTSTIRTDKRAVAWNKKWGPILDSIVFAALGAYFGGPLGAAAGATLGRAHGDLIHNGRMTDEDVLWKTAVISLAASGASAAAAPVGQAAGGAVAGAAAQAGASAATQATIGAIATGVVRGAVAGALSGAGSAVIAGGGRNIFDTILVGALTGAASGGVTGTAGVAAKGFGIGGGVPGVAAGLGTAIGTGVGRAFLQRALAEEFGLLDPPTRPFSGPRLDTPAVQSFMILRERAAAQQEAFERQATAFRQAFADFQRRRAAAIAQAETQGREAFTALQARPSDAQSAAAQQAFLEAFRRAQPAPAEPTAAPPPDPFAPSRVLQAMPFAGDFPISQGAPGAATTSVATEAPVVARRAAGGSLSPAPSLTLLQRLAQAQTRRRPTATRLQIA